MIALLWMGFARATEPAVAPEKETELLEQVEALDPAQHQRLLALRDTDRASYLAALYQASRISDRARRDPAYAERIRQIAERDRELRTMAAGFAALPAAEQAAARARMVALAGELLDLKQAERRLRVEELRARLEALEREIAERDRRRDAMVEEYVNRLTVHGVDGTVDGVVGKPR